MIKTGFGNFAVTLSRQDFADFFDLIKKNTAEQLLSSDLYNKTIVIPTPCEGIKILLSPKELNELFLMLDTADTELRSQELISLFGSH